MIDIVVGLGYGDEGKGRVVDWLSHNTFIPKLHTVVRFNGGCQAGHTVVNNGRRHVFSHFGSGTLNGVKTFWSKYCPIMPVNLNQEGKVLEKLLKIEDWTKADLIKFDPRCPITTHFDVIVNHIRENTDKHGSVGIGFGETVARHENTPYKLYAIDLNYPNILREKLNMIFNYYRNVFKFNNPLMDSHLQSCLSSLNKDELIENFVEVVKLINFSNKMQHISNLHGHLIFEGAQGTLLDQDHGVAFPHLTRSNTTIKNAINCIKEIFGDKFPVEIKIWYVSRTYHTRHGNGPLFYETSKENLNLPDDKTNFNNKWQGEFRYAPLNKELFEYALKINHLYNDINIHDYNIVFTHYDQRQLDLNELDLRGYKVHNSKSESGEIEEIYNLVYSR